MESHTHAISCLESHINLPLGGSSCLWCSQTRIREVSPKKSDVCQPKSLLLVWHYEEPLRSGEDCDSFLSGAPPIPSVIPCNVCEQMVGKVHLVKISEKPWSSRREGCNAAKGVPNWEGPPNKLIASWRIHGIDAHVAAA